MFGAPTHMRASAAEIAATIKGAEAAMAADRYLEAIPVATLTAGPVAAGRNAWKEAQARPARLSKRGSSINVDAASHTTILGPIYGQAVIDAIARVKHDAVADMTKSGDPP
jgi:hypothetical protein